MKERPVANAPAALIALCGRTNLGKAILMRLLTDPRMEQAWKQTKQHCRTEEDYPRLWIEIVYALKKSRVKEPSRKMKQKQFLDLADDARKLAKRIAGGPLDCLAYNYFPDQMAQRIFDVKNWPALSPTARFPVAGRALSEWPSIIELLEEFAQHADKVAMQALSENRLAVNDTHDRQVNYFLQHLARYFRAHFNAPMQGVLANIASVVFERSIGRDFVKSALRHSRPLL